MDDEDLARTCKERDCDQFSELEGADSESNSPNFRHLPRASRLPKPSSTALSPRERENLRERECERQTERLERKWVVMRERKRGGARDEHE